MILGIIIGLVLGALLVIIGVSMGISKEKKRTLNRKPESVEAICGCEHHFSYHDPLTGACVVEVPRGEYVPVPVEWSFRTVYDSGTPRRYLTQSVKCQCKRYAGPEPLNEFYAIEQATT